MNVGNIKDRYAILFYSHFWFHFIPRMQQYVIFNVASWRSTDDISKEEEEVSDI